MAFDLKAHLDRTKAVRPSHPFLGSGNHKLTVCEFRKSNSPDAGTIYAVDVVIDESDAADHKPGTMRSAIFKVERRPEFASQDSDADRLVELFKQLTGADTIEKAQEQAHKTLADDATIAKQRARGMRIDAFGAPPKTTKKGKPFVNVTWQHVPQTKEQIAARRRALDVSHPAGVAAAPVEPPPPPPSQGGSMLDDLD